MKSATIYGKMSIEHLEGFQDKAPGAWQNSSNWSRWKKSIVDVLDTNFWPSRSRLGAPGYPNARIKALTRCDLDVLTALQAEGKPTSPQTFSEALRALNIAASNATIWECFERENLWGTLKASTRNNQITTVPVGLLASYQHAFPNGVFGPDAPDVAISSREQQFMATPVDSCIGSVTELLKLEFQRPRPFQVAEEFGYPNFFHWVSSSANSPALPAGHELQAIFVFLCCVRELPLSATSKNLKSFASWCAGIGDRRVYAGLHYPSDILASQLIAASMLDEIFPGSEVEQLRTMLRLYLSGSHSLRKIREHHALVGNSSPFNGALAALDKQMPP